MVTEKAILAGGCFWGMQDLIRKLDGVVSTRVGYTGGDVPNATYRNHGSHAEAIEIQFDPERISYRDLLEFFFQIHDPTTKNRQGNDVGRATARRSTTSTTSSAASPRTRSPTSTPPASGRARSSPRWSPPDRSGRPSPSTRTTSSATPTATPVTSSGPVGDCRSGPRLQGATQDERPGSPSSRLIVTNWVRSSSGCATDDCGRISVTSQPSTMPSPPSIRPSGPAGRRSSAFVHQESLTHDSDLRWLRRAPARRRSGAAPYGGWVFTHDLCAGVTPGVTANACYAFCVRHGRTCSTSV